MRMSEAEYEALIARQGYAKCTVLKDVPVRTSGSTAALPPPAKRGTPNKTEAEYGRMLAAEFPGCRITFEGITLRMSNGHRYTPDWVVQTHGGWMLLVEVKARGKNGYRHPSYQRARLAFDQCREEYDCFNYRWAEKSSGRWEW